MAYNSSGVFSRLFDWTDDRDNGIKIRADRFDQELDGFATGLTTSLLKDGTQTATAKIPFAVGLSVIDNQTVLLGTNSDIAIQYDESTNDSLEIAANVEGAALGIVLKADQGDDNADQHKLTIADGGTLTLGSKISGSFVTYLTHTPNATVASSTLAVAGNLTVGGNLTLGSGAELSEAELEMLDGLTGGTVTASKAVVVDANKDIASFRNITLTGELDAGSLDVSGNADIDGTLEADAITVGGVSLAETISDTVGAMFSSNTETGITATYQDADNTIDLVIGAGDIVNSMLADDAVGADELASSAVVTDSIVDANVTLAKIANQAANTVLVRDANSSGVVSAKAVTDTQILIGDGTGFTAASLSGDVTMTNAGAVTIANGAVENAMLADDAVGADELAANAVVEASIVDNAVTLAKMAGIARGKLIIGDASGDPSVIGPGNNGQVLTSDGTDIAFADPAGASSLAADNLTIGDAAVLLTTSSGNITIDAAANDSDIIFKGTDGGADTTFLTIDGSAAGAATFNNDVTAFSDKRLKTDISNIDNGLDKVMRMQGIYYKRNDVEDARVQVGVLAQDMEAVLPEVVLTADDEMQTKSVDYGKICSVLIEAVKELKNEIDELKKG